MQVHTTLPTKFSTVKVTSVQLARYGGALHHCHWASAIPKATTCRTRPLVPLTHLTPRATELVAFRPPRCPRGPAPALTCRPDVLSGEGVARGAAAEGCLGDVVRGLCGCHAARSQFRLCPFGCCYQVGGVPPPPLSLHPTAADAEGVMGFDARNSRQPAALPAPSPRVRVFTGSCEWGCPRLVCSRLLQELPHARGGRAGGTYPGRGHRRGVGRVE